MSKKKNKEIPILKQQNQDFKELLMESIRSLQSSGPALRNVQAPAYVSVAASPKPKRVLSKKQIAALKSGRKKLRDSRK